MMPEISLRTLADCEVMLTVDGMPALRRTSQTVEAEIRHHGRRYLLAMPLSEAIAQRLERSIAQLERLNSPALAPIRLLPDELQGQHPSGERLQESLILQELPGESLWNLFGTIAPTDLHRALEQLDEELARIDLAHNNLKSENICWTGERLVAIRPWHAVVGGSRELDRTALKALQPECDTELTLSDYEEPYQTTPYRWQGNNFEGLICFESDRGFGYMDAEHRIVIEPQYLWADDFHEGRAVVECASGMGVIDREGRFVIPPHYEMIEYRYVESVFRIRKQGLWATFDITGQQTSLFMEEAKMPQFTETINLITITTHNHGESKNPDYR